MMNTSARATWEYQTMHQPENQLAVVPSQGNSERHNHLLGQFKLYWNVHQFYLSVDEKTKETFSALHVNFTEAFKKFKRCKAGLNVQPDSEQVSLQLDALDRDVDEIERWLNANDGAVTVNLIRCTLESLDPSKRGAAKTLLDYYLAKKSKDTADRDKIDYLITLYCHDGFKSIIHLDSLPELESKIASLVPASSGLDTLVSSELFHEYLVLLREAQKVKEFGDFVRLEILNKIREYKQRLGDYFYHPSLLARIILLNGLIREKFEDLLREENQKTEDNIIKLAEVGGDIVVEGNTPNLSGLSLLRAKELKNNLTENLHEEYSKTLEKISTLNQLRDTLDRSMSFYGLNVDDTRVGLGFALKFNNNREEDDLRNTIADLGMLVRANTSRGSTVARFKYRDILVIFSAWEVEAFREGPLSSDCHLRIRQAVRRTVGLTVVIQDILKQYKDLQSPTMPRRLLLALEYYLLKAQELQTGLKDVADEAIRLMLKVEAFHLSSTQTRLSSTIATVKPLFGQSRTA